MRATILPWAIILTKALRATVSIVAKDCIVAISGRSTGRQITPTIEIKRPTSGTLKTYLVCPCDLFIWQRYIVSLSIVLWSTTSH